MIHRVVSRRGDRIRAALLRFLLLRLMDSLTFRPLETLTEGTGPRGEDPGEQGSGEQPRGAGRFDAPNSPPKEPLTYKAPSDTSRRSRNRTAIFVRGGILSILELPQESSPQSGEATKAMLLGVQLHVKSRTAANSQGTCRELEKHGNNVSHCGKDTVALRQRHSRIATKTQ